MGEHKVQLVTPNTIKYLKELDGVRAIAALMVMFFHFFQHLETHNDVLSALRKLAFFGQTGVSLFFVLSGFLITRILISSKNSKKYFLNFYARRSLRIFPLYYFYLSLVFIIIPLLEGTDIPAFKQQIYHWIYLQDFAITFHWDYKGPLHFWSLAVEEHFYLFFPLLVYYLKNSQLISALITIVLTSVFLRFILSSNGYEVFFFTFTRMDELVFGAFIAVLEIKGMLTNEKLKHYVLGFILTSIPTVIIWLSLSGKVIVIIQVVKYLFISLNYFFIIAALVSMKDTAVLKKFFNKIFFVYTGKISYGLYVYHGICFNYINKWKLTDNLALRFLLSFAFAYVIASLSYYLIEIQFLKLKKLFQSEA